MDRHEKWTPVSPGTVIPAGQPYRWERRNPKFDRDATNAAECVGLMSITITHDNLVDEEWLVDSLWKPPLALPIEPTWGIVIDSEGDLEPGLGKWQRSDEFISLPDGSRRFVKWTSDFIPLTDEQVARIEAAR